MPRKPKPKPSKIRAWATQIPGSPITLVDARMAAHPFSIYRTRKSARQMRDPIAGEQVVPVTITVGH